MKMRRIAIIYNVTLNTQIDNIYPADNIWAKKENYFAGDEVPFNAIKSLVKVNKNKQPDNGF